VVDCSQSSATPRTLLEQGMAATDCSNNPVKAGADVSCKLGSDSKHEAMERWRQRKAEKHEKRQKRVERVLLLHGIGRTEIHRATLVSDSPETLAVSSITSFGQRRTTSSAHSPLTHRGALREDAAITMSDDSWVSEDEPIRRVWSFQCSQN